MTSELDSALIRSSLVVLNFNGEAFIENCIDSLLAAMSDQDELIVVDNGSQDSSLDILRTYERRIQIVALKENSFIFGLNDGLAVASGRFVAFLNNDMTVDANFVNECSQILDQASPDVFAVCPRILTGKGVDQGSRTSGYWSRGLLFYQSLDHVDAQTNCFFAVGGQSFFRRDYLLEIGSIDPLLRPMYHEDIELSYRAWKRGWRVVYGPDAIAHHLGSLTSKKVFTASSLRAVVRQNEFLIVWKNMTDFRLILSHIVWLPLRLCVALFRGDFPTLRGFHSALRRFPEVRRSRAVAKAHFALTDSEVLKLVAIR